MGQAAATPAGAMPDFRQRFGSYASHAQAELASDVEDVVQVEPGRYVGLAAGGVAGGVVEVDGVRVFLAVASGDLLAGLVGLTPGG